MLTHITVTVSNTVEIGLIIGLLADAHTLVNFKLLESPLLSSLEKLHLEHYPLLAQSLVVFALLAILYRHLNRLVVTYDIKRYRGYGAKYLFFLPCRSLVDSVGR